MLLHLLEAIGIVLLCIVAALFLYILALVVIAVFQGLIKEVKGGKDNGRKD